MPPYSSPEQGSFYGSRFTRIDRAIAVSNPNDFKTPHIRLIIELGITSGQELLRLKKEKPNQIDGGFMKVMRRRNNFDR